MTTFVVNGQPKTKGSSVSFMGKDGRIVTKADCRSLGVWSQVVGWAARAAHVQLAPAGVPVNVEAVFFFVRPKSQRKRPQPTVKPDLDKLVRALLDALVGVAFHDDAQVVELVVAKAYSDHAYTTVTVD